MRILLIEDEKDLAAPVIEHLKADQNVVDWFETLSDGDAAAFGVPYDVILLDLQLFYQIQQLHNRLLLHS